MVTFDREVDAATVNDMTMTLTAAGGDMAFGQANDTVIMVTPTAAANLMSAEFDLAGVMLADDLYRIRLVGNGNQGILDLNGNALDGDGNGVAGGDFVSDFSIMAPVVLEPNLDSIQMLIFTPMCSSCHGGAAPSGGLALTSAAVSYAQLVGQPSTGLMGAIRVIENDSVNSYLIQKLEGAPGIFGVRMPPGGMVPQPDIDTIKLWIDSGAAP